jgi:hypothetical protein
MAQKTADFLPYKGDDITDVYTTSVIDESAEELTAAEKAANAAIEQLSSNAEKGKTIRIYRQLGSGQESMEFVAKYPADKYSIDDLIDMMQKEYGGGDYRFLVYNEKGKIAANKLISIAAKQKVENSDNGIYGVFSQYMNKQDVMLQKLLEEKSGQNNSRMDFMKEMLIMKQLFDRPEPSGGSAVGQMKELMEAMDLMKQFNGNNEKENDDMSFSSIIKESMPLLTEIAKGARTGRPINSNPNGRPQRRESKSMEKMAIDKLLAMCKAGESPDTVAQKISDQIPDQYVPQIEALILGDDALDKIAALNPEFLQHGEWLKDTVEWLKWIFGYESKFDTEDLTDEANSDNIASNDTAKNEINGDSQR